MARDGLGGIVLAIGLSGLATAYLLFGSRSVAHRPRADGPRRGSPFLDVAGERILIFGDSLSHPGADAGPVVVDVGSKDRRAITSSAPGAVLAAHLAGVDAGGGERASAVRLNARVGRSACSFLFREESARLLAADRAWHPTKVIVMLGTNDIDRGTSTVSLELTKDALRQIRDAYLAMGAEVVAIGPPRVPEQPLYSGYRGDARRDPRGVRP